MITETTANEWLSKKVTEVIADSGITKKAIAEKTGMPYSTLNSKVRGYSPFTFDELLRIANVTNRDPSEFVPPQFHKQNLAA